MPRDTPSIIEEIPIVIMPSLAIALGIEFAAIVQRVAFCCQSPRSGKIHEGRRWVYNTYEQWQRDHFPWWSVETVKDYFQVLERNGILVSKQLDGRLSRKKSYRVCEGFSAKLTKRYAEGLIQERLKLSRKGKLPSDEIRPFISDENGPMGRDENSPFHNKEYSKEINKESSPVGRRKPRRTKLIRLSTPTIQQPQEAPEPSPSCAEPPPMTPEDMAGLREEWARIRDGC